MDEPGTHSMDDGTCREPLRRVGLIGDVHAEDALLAAALKHLSRGQLDAILCVGDIVDGPGDVNRCVALLEEQGVQCVRGNHDRWIQMGVLRDIRGWHRIADLDSRAWDFITSLPRTREFDTVAGRLLLCHGVGNDDMTFLNPDSFGYDLTANLELQRLMREREFASMVCGHTHRRMVRRFGKLCVLNVGSLCRDQEPIVTIADFEAWTVSHYLLDPRGESIRMESSPLLYG